MKINIKNIFGKTISFDVDRTYTVYMVKDMIQHQQGFSHFQQRLLFEDEELDDMCTLNEYNIQENSSLELRAKFQQPNNNIYINIENSLGEKIMIRVFPNETVKEVKLKIKDLENISLKKQSLFFSGIPLEDEKVLSFYNIQNNSTIQLSVNFIKQKLMTVVVKNGMNETIIVDNIKKSEQIKKLKMKIQEIEGIPQNQQRLIFNDKELEDDKTLSSYNIKNNSIVNLSIIYNIDVININIVSNNIFGDVFSLTVQPTDTIENIKNMIKEEVNIPFEQQFLSYNNMELENYNNLSDYGIKNGSDIQLIVRLYTNNIPVVILNEKKEKLFTLMVKPLDTINNIKTMIKKKSYIPIEQQHLFSLDNNLELYNEINFLNYNFHELILKIGFYNHHNNKMQIYINNYNGDSLMLSVKPTDTIEYVKSIIEEMEGIPMNQQYLSYNNKIPLINESLISDYAFEEESSIILDYRLNNSNNNRNTKIYIKNKSGESYVLDVQLSYTVLEIKELIQEKMEFSPEQYYLYYNNEELNDNKTLSYYNIRMGSTITMVLCFANTSTIYIKNSADETLLYLLNIGHFTTINDIKLMIYEKIKYPLNDFDIYFNHMKLEDNRTLSNYNIISKESTLYLLKKNKLKYSIFVVDFKGKTHIINVTPSSTIKDIKDKIEIMMKVPPSRQCLLYCGKRLNNDKTINDYKIGVNATLRLSIKHM